MISTDLICFGKLFKTICSITDHQFSIETIKRLWDISKANRPSDQDVIVRAQLNNQKYTLLLTKTTHILLTHRKQGDRLVGSPGGHKLAKYAVNFEDPTEIEVIAIERTPQTFTEGKVHKLCSKIPGVVTLKTWIFDKHKSYFLMEYCQNGTMGHIFSAEPSIEIAKRSIQWIYDTAKSLNEIHKIGFIHGDIHPKNVFITANNDAKVADFGNAISRTAKNLRVDLDGFDSTLAMMVGYQTEAISSLNFLSYYFFNSETIKTILKLHNIYQQFQQTHSLETLITSMEEQLACPKHSEDCQ